MNRKILLIFSIMAISSCAGDDEKLEQYHKSKTNIFGMLLDDLHPDSNPEEMIAEIISENLGFKSTKDDLNWISFAFDKSINIEYPYQDDFLENTDYFTKIVETDMEKLYTEMISTLEKKSNSDLNFNKKDKVEAFESFVKEIIKKVTEIYHRSLVAQTHSIEKDKNLEPHSIVNKLRKLLSSYLKKFNDEYNPNIEEGLIYRVVNGQKEYVNPDAREKHVDNVYVRDTLREFFNKSVSNYFSKIPTSTKSKNLKLIKDFLDNIVFSISETINEFFNLLSSKTESKDVLKKRFVSILKIVDKVSKFKTEMNLELVYSQMYNQFKEVNDQTPVNKKLSNHLVEIAYIFFRFVLKHGRTPEKDKWIVSKIKNFVNLKYPIVNFSGSKKTTSLAFIDFTREVDFKDSYVLYLIFLNMKEVEQENKITPQYVEGLANALPYLFTLHTKEIETLTDLQSLLFFYLFDENDTSEFYHTLLMIILKFTKEFKDSTEDLYHSFNKFVDNYYTNNPSLLFYFDIKFTIFTLLENNETTLEFIKLSEEANEVNKKQIYQLSTKNLKTVLNNIFVINEGKKVYPLKKDESEESKLYKHIDFAQGKEFNSELKLIPKSKMMI